MAVQSKSRENILLFFWSERKHITEQYKTVNSNSPKGNIEVFKQ